MNTEPTNMIPVADVTEEQEKAAYIAESVAKVTARIAAGEQFVFSSIGEQQVHVLCSAESMGDFVACLLGCVTTLGVAELGEAAEKLPEPMRQPVALSTGLQRLNEAVQSAFGQMGVVGTPGEPTH